MSTPAERPPADQLRSLEQESLFQEALREAQKHKYLESQRAGRDLGIEGIDDWQRRFWTPWFRYHWLEHLLGLRCWEELEPWRFGRLRTLFPTHEALVAEVADLVRRGAENADILWWAAKARRELPVVMAILTEVRINEIRCSRHCFLFARPPGE
ncbi:MAG: hypothetical protein FJ291_25870 [Planctomycetes bacterium]|nr:hypothetical protein [Planctomycetota bacterium]